MNAYIYEGGRLIPAQESKESVFCGYYAACGYHNDNPGDLFAVLSGPILAPAYDRNGVRMNVGSEKAGLSYDNRRKEWYKE